MRSEIRTSLIRIATWGFAVHVRPFLRNGGCKPTHHVTKGKSAPEGKQREGGMALGVSSESLIFYFCCKMHGGWLALTRAAMHEACSAFVAAIHYVWTQC